MAMSLLILALRTLARNASGISLDLAAERDAAPLAGAERRPRDVEPRQLGRDPVALCLGDGQIAAPPGGVVVVLGP